MSTTRDTSKLFEGQPPYTQQPEKTYAIKIHVDGIGWVEVETTTEFIANGMLKQAADKIANGQYRKCEPPKEGERVVSL